MPEGAWQGNLSTAHGRRPREGCGARPRRFDVRGRIAAFIHDAAGTVTVFSLFLLIVILMVGGMAVDVLRYEHQRVRLQSTADRAVLAAGNLRQPNDPHEVVAEYFAKEGLSDFLDDVTIDEGLNFRTVSVQTSAVIPSIFLRLVGIKSLTADAASTAEERYNKVEVALVLDLSNSMNSFNRIENLRDAGAEFIDTLFENSEEDQISVTVVNYTGQTNPGEQLASYFNVSDAQPFSHCVEFDAQDFESMALQPGASLEGSGHFDPWHTSRARNMIFCPSPRLPQFSHSDNTHRENIVMSGNPEFLTDYLEGLWADGNTSIEIGLRWGAAMLDPSSRPIVADMAANGLVHSAFADRPLDYDDEESLKAMVLMTDGENFEQWIMNDAYKTGQSDVWHTVFFNQAPAQGGMPSLEDEIYGILNGTIQPTGLQRHRFDAVSVPQNNPDGLDATRPNRNVGSGGGYDSTSRAYLSVRPGNSGNWYLPRPIDTNPGNSGDWRDSPWTTSSSLPATGSWWSQVQPPTATGCSYHPASDTPLAFDFQVCDDRVAYRMTHPWLWDNFSVRWVAHRLYHNSGIQGYSSFMNSVLSTRPASTKNEHLDTMCNTIKSHDIPIFTVAFEAPPGGVSAMQSCASSLNHFYDVEGTDIGTAFRAIAGTINRLRLTQ